MIDNKTGESLKEEFLSICERDIHRDGIDRVLEWLDDSDFFYAPASTRFHGNYEYGLLEHSLNVYKSLKELAEQHSESFVFSDETIAVCALFHDICKANLYVVGSRNVKDEATGKWYKEAIYKHDDKFPIGHGEKSVIILLRLMALTDDEIYAIRYHMGGFDSAVKGGDGSISKAYELCPLAVLLHLADMTASYLMEDRNA